MTLILPVKTQARWIVQRAGKTILDGVTIVKNATGVDPTCTVIQAEGDAEFLTVAKGQAGTYKPLPAAGEWVEAELYGYEGSFVVCRKAHQRGKEKPEQLPDLFVVDREVAEKPAATGDAVEFAVARAGLLPRDVDL